MIDRKFSDSVLIHFVERMSLVEGVLMGKVHKMAANDSLWNAVLMKIQCKYPGYTVSNTQNELQQYPSFYKGTQVIRAQSNKKGKTVPGESVRFLLPSGQSGYCHIRCFLLWHDTDHYVKVFQVFS